MESQRRFYLASLFWRCDNKNEIDVIAAAGSKFGVLAE
ncbi:hypothetical protein imdm_620 [gamma proteobacterium IMCC2047]|nr:hypothetical protein imdm_620 [gamma proteobacterium IMCC2047]